MVISLGRLIDTLDGAPWAASVGRSPAGPSRAALPGVSVPCAPMLYTPEQRRRRDETPWTTVQAVLAPVQVAACVISTVLVMRFLLTGQGCTAATASVLVKTVLLYAIMVTGSFWEKAVFGRWLFAPAFYWEDAVSFGVIGLHTAYLAVLFTGALPPGQAMLVALAGYAAYVVNALQFVSKLRAARQTRPALGLAAAQAGS